MTASVLKQDQSTKRFKRTLIYFNTDTQCAHFWGQPLYQLSHKTLKTKKETYFASHLLACYRQNIATCLKISPAVRSFTTPTTLLAC